MREKEMWSEYCKKSGTSVDTPYEAWQFGGDADLLAELVLKGKKKATASCFPLYEIDECPVPVEGDYSVVLNTKDEAVCIIRNTKVYTTPFKNVDEKHAYKEGEGDLSLDFWQKVHREFFIKEMSSYGLDFTAETGVLCEEFEKVWPLTD